METAKQSEVNAFIDHILYMTENRDYALNSLYKQSIGNKASFDTAITALIANGVVKYVQVNPYILIRRIA